MTIGQKLWIFYQWSISECVRFFLTQTLDSLKQIRTLSLDLIAGGGGGRQSGGGVVLSSTRSSSVTGGSLSLSLGGTDNVVSLATSEA